jgi:hypothetical protein
MHNGRDLGRAGRADLVAGTIGYVLAGLPQQALTPPFSLGFVSLIGFALMAPVSSSPLWGALAMR